MATGSDKRTRGRLDQYLVDRGDYATRSRARDAILRGSVTVDGETATKPGRPVSPDAQIAVADPAERYVARSALKLAFALDHFGIDPDGCLALDVGASTGGFTQVLLERGASRVVALDVGHGQLHPALADDPRVTSLERVNARDLDLETLGGARPDLVVCDVSFISLRLVLPALLAVAAPAARGVFLVKPQFEVGREAIGAGGIVRDRGLGEETAASLSGFLDGHSGWRTLGHVASPIEGGDGNREYLIGGSRAP